MYAVMANKNDIIIVDKTNVSHHRNNGLGFKHIKDFMQYEDAENYAKSLELSPLA